MHLIAIGRLRGGPEAELFERYNTRLRPRVTIAELPEERGTACRSQAKGRRGAAGRLAARRFRGAPRPGRPSRWIAEAFARQLGQWAALSRPVYFLIGGAEGLDASVIGRADYVLSLGAMTWPHFLVRAMLAEQLYRAQAIAQGHPYHRGGRPDA